jgi:Fic-DOC domain mobile mystery protein B
MTTIPDLNATPGNTPFHPDDAAQLIPNLATRRELDEWERQNILQAQTWAFSPRGIGQRDPLDEIYVRELHRRMFDATWKWAGKYRIRDGINLGCPFTEIHQRIVTLLGNVRFWIEHQTFSVDEIAVRFHHQIVGQIHAFQNGNGRHARLIASVLAVRLGRPRFTWGRETLVDPGPSRQAYLDALRAADDNENNIQRLVLFARS